MWVSRHVELHTGQILIAFKPSRRVMFCLELYRFHTRQPFVRRKGTSPNRQRSQAMQNDVFPPPHTWNLIHWIVVLCSILVKHILHIVLLLSPYVTASCIMSRSSVDNTPSAYDSITGVTTPSSQQPDSPSCQRYIIGRACRHRSQKKVCTRYRYI